MSHLLNERRRTLTSFVAMATPCEICVDAPPAVAEQAIAQAVAEVRRIESRYSRFRAESIVGQINAAAGDRFVTVDAELAALLDYGQHCWQISDGAFDLTSGVLREVWFQGMTARPDRLRLAATLARVGWQRVEWERIGEGGRIRLGQGMQIDLGGIGKEYAADRAATLLVQSGVLHGYVNLGGDVAVIGPQGDGSPWTVGIADPRGGVMPVAHIDLYAGGLATSGQGERHITVDGVRYGHIIHARTGWPVDELASVSVLAPSTVVAGTLSTCAMLLGRRGAEWLRTMSVRAWCIFHDGQAIAM